MWGLKLWRYSVLACAVLAVVGVGVVHGEAYYEEEVEIEKLIEEALEVVIEEDVETREAGGPVQIPAGWGDSRGSASNDEGWRKAYMYNDSPDVMTIELP